jgi:Trypsin-co-occurring domain 1
VGHLTLINNWLYRFFFSVGVKPKGKVYEILKKYLIMAQNKEFAQFFLDDGTPFLIEIQESESPNIERAANVDLGQEVAKAKQSFETALGHVVPVASAALQRLKNGLTTPADEVELKFGITLNVEAGAIFTSVGGEANFEITLTWKRP